MKPSKTNSIRRKRKKASLSHLPPSAPALGGDNNNSGSAVLKEEEEEKGRALDWLTEAFASASIDQISSAYLAARGDAHKAAGILASHLEDPGPGSVDLSSSSAGVSGVKEAGEGYRRRSRRHKRVFSAASGMVSNVIGKGYTNEGKMRSDGNLAVEEEVGMMPGTCNIEETEEFLCSMLGNDSELGMGVVKDVLGQCGCDIGKALDVLLDMATSSFSSLNGGTCKNNDRRNNSGTCPEISSNDFSKNMIASYQSSNDTLRERYHLPEKANMLPDMGYVTREQLLLRPDQTKPVFPQEVLESLFHISEHQTYEPHRMNWKKVAKKIESFNQGLEFRSSSSSDTQSDVSDGKEDLYEVFRSASRQNWDTMRKYYHKAAMAYSNGERAHASILSQKGMHYRDLAHEANERASRDIFEARNREIKNTVTIDLHGQHAKQAIGLVKLHLVLFSYIPSVKFLKVITGRGADCVEMGKLKRSVLALTKKEGMECVEENVGTLILRLDMKKVYSFVGRDGDSE